MARPDKLPEWASDGTQITEPTSGQKATGWNGGQAPGSEVQNWWQEKVYRWVEYLALVPVKHEMNLLRFLSIVDDTGGSNDLSDIDIHPSTGQMITVGAAGAIYSSVGSDGSTSNVPGIQEFVAETPGSAYAGNFTGIQYNPVFSVWQACGSADEIQTSTGNGTWTRRSNSGDDFKDIAYNTSTGTAVAVGDNAHILLSTNGTTWGTSASSAFAGEDIGAIAFGAGVFVSITRLGKIQSSNAGGTGWTSRFTGAIAGANDRAVFLDYHENWGFVAMHDAQLYQSDDGITWSTLIDLEDTLDVFEMESVIKRMDLLPNVVAVSLDDSGTAVSTAFVCVYRDADGAVQTQYLLHAIPGRTAGNERVKVLNNQVFLLTGDQVWNSGVL